MEFCSNFSLPHLLYLQDLDMKQVMKNTFDLFLEIDLLSIGHATKYLNVMHPPNKTENHPTMKIFTFKQLIY